jgi:WD40 repeat protein
MAIEPKHLQLDAVIGFEGTVQNGLIFHPDGQHLIYPLGSTVVIRDLSTSHSQRFLHGHVDKVSTVTLSPCGRYLASGQVTHMGFTAPILVWDFETGAILHKLELHKVLVQGWLSRAKTTKAAYSWHQLAARTTVTLLFGTQSTALLSADPQLPTT